MTVTRAISCAGLAAIVLVAGCNDQSSVVRGTVTLDGKPIVGGPQMYGTVTFYHSDGSGAPAVGIIDESGRYLLKTGTEGKLPPGDYLVGIAVKQITKPSTLGGMPQAHLITHAKYTDVNESGLKTTVRPGTNTFDFALTSGGPDKANRAQ
jgi:hypothetical protein